MGTLGICSVALLQPALRYNRKAVVAVAAAVMYVCICVWFNLTVPVECRPSTQTCQAKYIQLLISYVMTFTCVLMITIWQVYALDLYPVPVLAMGNGFMRMVGQVGAAFSALLFASGTKSEAVNKMIICMAVIAGMVILQLCFLNGKQLPEKDRHQIHEEQTDMDDLMDLMNKEEKSVREIDLTFIVKDDE